MGGSLRRRRFAETEMALVMGQTARVWRSSPSLVSGLPQGSVEAFLLDKRVAERLLEEDEAEQESGSVGGGAAGAVPLVPAVGGVGGVPMPDPTGVPWAPGHEPVLGGG